MENKNYSNEIRKYISRQYNYAKNYFENDDKETVDITYLYTLDAIEEDLKCRLIVSNRTATINDLEIARLFAKLSRIQMYTDYYRYLKFQDVLYNSNLVKNFPEINSYEDLKMIFEDQIAACEMIKACLEFSQSSGYDKVLLTKCLTFNERSHLLKINPFFEYELKKYDLKVDLNFISRHLKKWQTCFPNDKEKSYDETVKFIADLYKISNVEGSKLIIGLLNELGNPFISNYASDESSKAKTTNLVMDNLMLKKMIKDYDEENNHTLKYTNGDLNGNK